MVGKYNVQIYDLVFIIEDNVAFCNCPLGKNVDLFSDNEGRIIVVRIKQNEEF